MPESRRGFLALALPWAAATVFAVDRRLAAQTGQPPDAPPFPGQPSIRAHDAAPAPRFDPKLILKENQEYIKKDVAQLSDLVANLQKGLKDSDTTEMLSLNVVHTLDEIEKLTRQIRGLVRG